MNRRTHARHLVLLSGLLLVAILLAGCLSPRVHYQGFDLVAGSEVSDGASLTSGAVVDPHSDYVVIRFESFPQDMKAEVVHLGEYYRLTRTDGTVSVIPMGDIHRDESLGYRPNESLSAFEERIRTRDDIRELERIGYNRTYTGVLKQGSTLVLEVDERGAAGAYRGIIWMNALRNTPSDRFEFTITPQEAADARGPLDNR